MGAGWIRWQVEVAPEAEEVAAEGLRALGAAGTEHQGSPDGAVRVVAYFPAERAPSPEHDFAHLQERLAASGLQPWPARLHQEAVDDEDWAERWKEHFPPMQIGRLWIRPSWEAGEPPPGTQTLVLDPGLAFGTGTHPTTRLCLKGLQRYLASGDVVADVGTGSGILAMGAALLGARRVVAVDVDPIAVRVARENVERNRLQWAVTVLEGSTEVAERAVRAVQPGGAQLVVANLLTSILVELAPTLVPILAPGGVLLASGIAAGQEGAVEAAFREVGLEVAGRELEEAWVLVVARRPRG
ncbi:MAG: 50S ribosomal protein L11 methyltransferase [Firmicutes bacterium]|uniref:50S ribosomal protein L11 methyltransferase n=1 Tax=Limnochorda sp. TaxID=1940279 RepID=UPI0018493656|nr:50S ribosomal protein L11 methyltransferase [Bacillota bacterium]